MGKVDDGKRKNKKEKKIMLFLVATNIVASRLPERPPTGTRHARAKIAFNKFNHLLRLLVLLNTFIAILCVFVTTLSS